MKLEMQKANLLSENINSFIKFVRQLDEDKCGYSINKQKLYQIILWIKEFNFQVIADELFRINRFDWDGKYTYYLVDSFIGGIEIIDEYVNYHSEDLFILSARLHTLKNLSSLFCDVKTF